MNYFWNIWSPCVSQWFRKKPACLMIISILIHQYFCSRSQLSHPSNPQGQHSSKDLPGVSGVSLSAHPTPQTYLKACLPKTIHCIATKYIAFCHEKKLQNISGRNCKLLGEYRILSEEKKALFLEKTLQTFRRNTLHIISNNVYISGNMETCWGKNCILSGKNITNCKQKTLQPNMRKY